MRGIYKSSYRCRHDTGKLSNNYLIIVYITIQYSTMVIIVYDNKWSSNNTIIIIHYDL